MQAVAFVFGPENGAVSEKLVFEAAREAHGKGYTHLYVIGFAIQPNARKLIENCESAMSIAATYVQATPDLMMGDLLKTMRSSQIFSVCGMPDVRLEKLLPEGNGAARNIKSSCSAWTSFDPIKMKPNHRKGNDVPAWLLDTDYNGLCFHVSASFLSAHQRMGQPQESAARHLRRSGVGSSGRHGQRAVRGGRARQRIAVKVIDDRGNELIVVKPLSEAV